MRSSRRAGAHSSAALAGNTFVQYYYQITGLIADWLTLRSTLGLLNVIALVMGLVLAAASGYALAFADRVKIGAASTTTTKPGEEPPPDVDLVPGLKIGAACGIATMIISLCGFAVGTVDSVSPTASSHHCAAGDDASFSPTSPSVLFNPRARSPLPGPFFSATA